MRDYLQFFYRSWEDSLGAVLNVYFETMDEAETFSPPPAPDPPWTGGDIEVRYLLLSKTPLVVWMNCRVGDVPIIPVEFQTPRYGIDGTKENPTYVQSKWPSNDGDPRNPTAEPATKRKGVGGGPFTLAQVIQQAMSRLLQIGGTRANLCAGLLGKVLADLLSKRIDEATAADRFDKIALAFRDLFGIG